MTKNLSISEKEILNFPNDSELGKYVRKKYWENVRIEEESKFTEYDNCVICGKLSPYTRETDITYRVGYVEGGGQGCFMPFECEKS